jgi:transaldolase
VKYVEALIGPETINTVPMKTLNAYLDHGDPAPRLEEELGAARQVMNRLSGIGIDIDAVTQRLEDEGVEKFRRPFDRLLEALGKKQRAAR